MPKYQLIVNPISGRGNSLKLLPLIEEKLKALNLDYNVVITERPWHAEELAEKAAHAGYDVVVAVGGDGTANEVLNGIMAARNGGKPAVMGVLCVGRGNDFAFSAGVPTDWQAGCDALAANQTRCIDIGKVTGGMVPQGRYFGNGVGIGFDAVVGFEAAKLRPLSGFVVYLIAALKTIFLFFDAPLVQINTNGQTIEQRSLMVSVMNGIRLGGGFMMAPNGVPDDGHFDICLAKQVSRVEIFKLIPRFMNGSQFGHPAISTIKTSKITVTGLNGGKLPAHADGETINMEGKYLEIELIPQQVEIIVGAGRGAA